MRDVAKRPQPLVGEAEVVAFFFLFGQPDSSQRVFGIVRRNPQMSVGVDGFLVGVATAMGHPFAVTST